MRKVDFFSVAWARTRRLFGGELQELEHPHDTQDPQLTKEDQAFDAAERQFDVRRSDGQKVNDSPQ